MQKLFVALFLVLTLLVTLGWATGALALNTDARSPFAATLYVDGQIGAGSCADYDPVARNCGSGADVAFATLTAAAAAAQPGDVVLVRAGVYSEQLAPQNSGTDESPIIYRNYSSETVTLTGNSSPATILLDDVSYLIIEGLVVEDARWLEARDAHHNIIRNNTFLRTPASGTTGNVRFITSNYNQIVGNTLHDGNDNLLLIDANYNLVEGNTITEGRHSVLSVRCADYNVIRNNFFSNTQQKIAEVYDCGDDTSAVPHSFDSTKHNVVEHNVFAEASSYYSTSGGNGIQYSGQDGIIRRNVFYHTNVGLGMQIYSDEALYNHRNRVYHNVFYDNDCAGISVRGGGINNVYKNNILFENKGVSGDCFGVGPAQVLYRSPLEEFFFVRNNILHEQPGEAVIQQEFGSGNTLAYFESSYPALFLDNLEIAPAFTDPEAHDFTLQGKSSMVDAGAFLARAINDGSGTTLELDDARYFHNGYGIAGIAGDTVQLEGQTETAVVVGVDYDNHILTLDRSLSWNAGQGISLVYEGLAPDVGAYEYVPQLTLYGAPADRAIHLNWTINDTLPATSTWQIDYQSGTGTAYLSITGIVSPTRAYTLTGLTNYVWYTVTLNAMLDTTPFLTDTVRVMPTGIFTYLPLVLKD